MEELIKMLLSPDPEVVNSGILLLRHTYKFKQELKAWAKTYAYYRKDNKFINKIDLLCKRSIPYELYRSSYWDRDTNTSKYICTVQFSSMNLYLLDLKECYELPTLRNN